MVVHCIGNYSINIYERTGGQIVVGYNNTPLPSCASLLFLSLAEHSFNFLSPLFPEMLWELRPHHISISTKILSGLFFCVWLEAKLLVPFFPRKDEMQFKKCTHALKLWGCQRKVFHKFCARLQTEFFPIHALQFWYFYIIFPGDFYGYLSFVKTLGDL